MWIKNPKHEGYWAFVGRHPNYSKTIHDVYYLWHRGNNEFIVDNQYDDITGEILSNKDLDGVWHEVQIQWENFLTQETKRPLEFIRIKNERTCFCNIGNN